METKGTLSYGALIGRVIPILNREDVPEENRMDVIDYIGTYTIPRIRRENPGFCYGRVLEYVVELYGGSE